MVHENEVNTLTLVGCDVSYGILGPTSHLSYHDTS